MSCQDSGLTLRKRHSTGYTEQLQQYSSPGERFGGNGAQFVCVCGGGYAEMKSWEVRPGAHQPRWAPLRLRGPGHACSV